MDQSKPTTTTRIVFNNGSVKTKNNYRDFFLEGISQNRLQLHGLYLIMDQSKQKKNKRER